MPDMRIFHIASRSDWEAARGSAAYTMSTYGRTLEQEGFLHAVRREQVSGVLSRHYAAVSEPLVLLEIETDLLDVPWREEQVDDGTFPHVYGPLPVRAVVGSRPITSRDLAAATGGPASALTRTFVGLSLVLAASAVTLFFCAVIEHERATTSADSAVASLLWSLSAVTLAACATAAALSRAFHNDDRRAGRQ
jgi:uncharacterized protein (DUF952 family)